MNVLLIGPPGSGKGTQGERLSERLGLEHIAAGDLLRAEVESDTDLGNRVRAYLDSGDLVPDALIVELMLPQVVRAARNGGYILDGFPRSVPQAITARKLAEEAGIVADAAIYLDVPRDELVERITARARDEGRTDDTPEVVQNRLQVYAESTHPLIDYYRGRGLLHTIDASRSEDEVTAAILDALELAAI
ncbi:MAG: adenylate kinase [Actinomycetota bacterium]